MFDSLVVFHVLVELMQFCASDISLVVEERAKCVVSHYYTTLGEESAHSDIVVGDIVFLIGIKEDDIEFHALGLKFLHGCLGISSVKDDLVSN